VTGADRETSTLSATLALQAASCDALGCTFYGDLLRAMATDADAGGPVAIALAPYAAAPPPDAYALRVLGGVHRRVLAGAEPELAAHFPSVGGDGDAQAAWLLVRALVARGCPEIDDALLRPPQTNEVGRAAALVGGFLVVAQETGLPVRALEVGTSAGLNLRLDRFRYEQGGHGFGPVDAPVRFEGLWPGATPPFGAPLEIVERAGCDRSPIDPTDRDGRLRLLSYVWPDPPERFTRARAACAIAAEVPATVDTADAVEWLPEQLAEVRAGVATVVFHSVFWQYLSDGARASLRATLHEAGARARPDAPLAWLRLEPDPAVMTHPELRLTVWPGGQERHLADAHFHLGPIHWPPP